jgi:hypothetical protein
VLGLGCELVATVDAGEAVAVVLEHLPGPRGVEQAGAGSGDAVFELAAQQVGALKGFIEPFELAAEGDDTAEVHGGVHLRGEGRTPSAELAGGCGLGRRGVRL